MALPTCFRNIFKDLPPSYDSISSSNNITFLGAHKSSKETHIKFHIKDNKRSNHDYVVRSTTKFEDVFHDCAARVGEKREMLWFYIDGERLTDDRTLKDVGMEDGDEIHVFRECYGG